MDSEEEEGPSIPKPGAFVRQTAEFKRYEVRIQEACQREFEQLLLKYEEENTFSFLKFSEIWRETKLNLLFAGLHHADDVGRFTEICMFTAIKLLVYPKNLNTQVGAFYLLYTLYYRQPLRDFVRIRLTHKVFGHLNELVENMKIKNQYDFLYIYGKLRLSNAFEYVATITPISINFNYLNIQDLPNDTFISTKGNFGNHVFNVIREDVEEFRDIHQQYVTAMSQFSAKFPEQNLSIFDSNIVKDLEDLLNTAKHENYSVTPLNIIDDEIGKKKLQVKKKAMKMINKSRRERLDEKEHLKTRKLRKK